MKYISINDKIITAKNLILKMNNRGFFYGDGFFETIRVLNGNPFNFQNHWSRIKKSANYLNFRLSSTEKDILSSINKVLSKNNHEKGAKVKVIIYRESAGSYRPISKASSILILSEDIENNTFLLNKQGLSLDWFLKENKNTTQLSNLKSLNSLVYVLASNYAKEKNLDDVIIFNQRKKPIESSNANIFVKKGGDLYTTPLSDGCVDGTMRLLICQNFNVVKTSFSRDFLLDAEELFLTNSMGIRWVEKMGNKRYSDNKLSKDIVYFLNTLI